MSGMVLVLGDLCGYQDPTDAAGKQALYALVQQMCGSFEASEGSLICRDLLGLAEGEIWRSLRCGRRNTTRVGPAWGLAGGRQRFWRLRWSP